MSKIWISGANGHLGLRLARALQGRHELCLVVRSEAAKAKLERALGCEVMPSERPATARGARSRLATAVQVVDYSDATALARTLQNCDTAIHLVGIIKESRHNSFVDAHVRTSEALLNALHGSSVQRLIYLSLVGARMDSANPCFASRGHAERLLAVGAVPALVLRLPMVLGEGDYASAALKKRASAGSTWVLRGASLEQPIYAGDVVSALQSALTVPLGVSEVYDLGGPQSLTRAQLIERASVVLGKRVTVRSLPIRLGMIGAGCLEWVMASPPVTRAMLGVLDHDDQVDPRPACRRLRVTLTALDDTLARCLRGDSMGAAQ